MNAQVADLIVWEGKSRGMLGELPLANDPCIEPRPGIDPCRAWGDYAGMAVVGPLEPSCNSDGTFFPFWCRAPATNRPPNVYTAPVTVGP